MITKLSNRVRKLLNRPISTMMMSISLWSLFWCRWSICCMGRCLCMMWIFLRLITSSKIDVFSLWFWIWFGKEFPHSISSSLLSLSSDTSKLNVGGSLDELNGMTYILGTFLHWSHSLYSLWLCCCAIHPLLCWRSTSSNQTSCNRYGL